MGLCAAVTPQLRMHKAVEEIVAGNVVYRHDRPVCGDPTVPKGRTAAGWDIVNCKRCLRNRKGRP